MRSRNNFYYLYSRSLITVDYRPTLISLFIRFSRIVLVTVGPTHTRMGFEVKGLFVVVWELYYIIFPFLSEVTLLVLSVIGLFVRLLLLFGTQPPILHPLWTS